MVTERKEARNDGRGEQGQDLITSAVTPDGGLYFMIREGSMNSNDMINFMEQFLSEINGFLYIFWDSITIHWSRTVKDFLEMHNDRLIRRRIPAYSPELNPDEFVWNALKYQELSNFCPARMDELKNKVILTMNRMKSNPEKMKNIIRGFEPFPSTNYGKELRKSRIRGD